MQDLYYLISVQFKICDIVNVQSYLNGPKTIDIQDK